VAGRRTFRLLNSSQHSPIYSKFWAILTGQQEKPFSNEYLSIPVESIIVLFALIINKLPKKRAVEQRVVLTIEKNWFTFKIFKDLLLPFVVAEV